MNKRPGLDGQDWIAAEEVDLVVAGLEAQLAEYKTALELAVRLFTCDELFLTDRCRYLNRDCTDCKIDQLLLQAKEALSHGTE